MEKEKGWERTKMKANGVRESKIEKNRIEKNRIEKNRIEVNVSEEEYQILSEKYKELEELISDLKNGFKTLERFQKFHKKLLKKVDRIVKKKLEEEQKQLIQERNCLREEYENIKKENSILKESMEQKKKEWEAEQKTLKEENTVLRKTEEKYRTYLINDFVGLQETLWKIDERDKEYEEFFNDSVFSLQVLMGLSKAFDQQTKEKIEYYIWDVIIEPLIGGMKKRNGEIQNGKLVFPKQKVDFDKKEVERKADRESLEQMEQYKKEDERRVELKEMVLQKKRVVEDLGRMLDELRKRNQTHTIGKEEIERLALEAQFLLEKNGIYPMFAKELQECSAFELKRRMIPINPNSIKYPGLFIRRNGNLEVFGTNIGMDDCEEDT